MREGHLAEVDAGGGDDVAVVDLGGVGDDGLTVGRDQLDVGEVWNYGVGTSLFSMHQKFDSFTHLFDDGVNSSIDLCRK